MLRFVPRWRVLLRICLLPVLPAGGAFLLHWQMGKLPQLQVHLPEVQVAEARKWKNALWVDARSREDYEETHSLGAIWLNEGDWQEGLPAVLDAWRPGRRVVVYCSTQSCQASQAVARRLREETGWKEIFVLKGGWEKLRNEGEQ